jgi:hypothetical protein
LTSNFTRRRKPSKAAMTRRLAEVQAQHEQLRELPSALAQLIDDYTGPSYTAVQMAGIGPFLRTVITTSTLTGVESVRKHCTHIAGLAA